jgi:hypothetical protein
MLKFAQSIGIGKQYIIPSSIPFEISNTSLGTQIMLPSQFVDFLEQI